MNSECAKPLFTPEIASKGFKWLPKKHVSARLRQPTSWLLVFTHAPADRPVTGHELPKEMSLYFDSPSRWGDPLRQSRHCRSQQRALGDQTCSCVSFTGYVPSASSKKSHLRPVSRVFQPVIFLKPHYCRSRRLPTPTSTVSWRHLLARAKSRCSRGMQRPRRKTVLLNWPSSFDTAVHWDPIQVQDFSVGQRVKADRRAA